MSLHARDGRRGRAAVASALCNNLQSKKRNDSTILLVYIYVEKHARGARLAKAKAKATAKAKRQTVDSGERAARLHDLILVKFSLRAPMQIGFRQY